MGNLYLWEHINNSQIMVSLPWEWFSSQYQIMDNQFKMEDPTDINIEKSLRVIWK